MRWFKKREEVDFFTPVSTDGIKEEPVEKQEEITDIQADNQEIMKDIPDPHFFGKIQYLVDDINITDIHCNSHSIWVNHINKGKFRCKDIQLNSEELEKLAYKIANIENKQFNIDFPILKADFNDLKIQCTHTSFSTSGTSLFIRKTPCIARLNEEKMISQEYCPNAVIDFLKYSIKSHLNIFIIGMVNDGKTELAKFLASYIPEYERIITIEETNEWHLSQLYPEKDIIELKVNECVDDNLAIKSCMSMLPTWILLSEFKKEGAKALLKSISTGAKVITTLHTDHVLNIPKKIICMLEATELNNKQIENIVYQSVNIGIRVKADMSKNKTYHYISQIAIFWVDNNYHHHHAMIYEVKKHHNNFYMKYYPLPEWIKERYAENNCSFYWRTDEGNKQ